MRCAQCDQSMSEARTLSTHHTSEGWVRYKRCACGGVSIELLTLDTRPTGVHAARA
ncbi:hypothetical protein [Pseudonocardia sp. WMMC193]|uniref:hypothetical protein n=1 Tax=Pseudonocardia sp. WMMC193 TaxID=2911965 RepID=UPI001F450F1E|nr:hypothetical protein [Pseudonocardia sp. WMMC193]MCF7551142.1 hypothetical protein [Pseudonocardia sp. WMMC193]